MRGSGSRRIPANPRSRGEGHGDHPDLRQHREPPGEPHATECPVSRPVVTVKLDKAFAVVNVETGMGQGDPAPAGSPAGAPAPASSGSSSTTTGQTEQDAGSAAPRPAPGPRSLSAPRCPGRPVRRQVSRPRVPSPSAPTSGYSRSRLGSRFPAPVHRVRPEDRAFTRGSGVVTRLSLPNRRADRARSWRFLGDGASHAGGAGGPVRRVAGLRVPVVRARPVAVGRARVAVRSGVGRGCVGPRR
jgi:hypothetical protein